MTSFTFLEIRDNHKQDGHHLTLLTGRKIHISVCRLEQKLHTGTDKCLIYLTEWVDLITLAYKLQNEA